MGLIWDTEESCVWFARWDDQNSKLRLYVVVEGLPGGEEWDWEVWLEDEPKIVKRGIAQSAFDASAAAGKVADECLRKSGEGLKRL